jgi:hypothetical protein
VQRARCSEAEAEEPSPPSPYEVQLTEHMLETAASRQRELEVRTTYLLRWPRQYRAAISYLRGAILSRKFLLEGRHIEPQVAT